MIGRAIHAMLPPALAFAICLPSPAAGRQGGDRLEDAFVISSLPFVDTGTTIGYGDDYDETCPYPGLSSPDVVYQYTAEMNLIVDLSLCNPGTNYDTKLFVYENDVDHPIACNDDACEGPDFPNGPYLSRLFPLHFMAGNTYFIVVCGYQDEAGDYTFTADAYGEHTHLVRPDGTGDFPTIQDAIDFAAPGDTIELADGVFSGEGNRRIDCHAKPLTIRSQSREPANCIIDCEGTAQGFVFTSFETYDSILEAVTITNGSSPGSYGGGIACSSSSPTIRNCVVTACDARWGGGMVVANCSPDLIGCTFVGNTATHGGGGIYLGLGRCDAILSACRFIDNEGGTRGGAAYCDGSPSPQFIDCTFFHNHATSAGGGIYCNIAHPQIRGCTIVKNGVSDPVDGMGGGIATGPLSSVHMQNTIVAFNDASLVGGSYLWDGDIDCCDAYANNNGDWGGIVDPTGTDGNIALDPLFCDLDGGDLTLDLSSPCRAFTPPNEECDRIGALGLGCPSAHVEEATTPRRWILSVAPNPAKRRVEIGILHVADGQITASIFDLGGRKLRDLAGDTTGPDRWSFAWDRRDHAGVRLPAGVYYLRVTASGRTESRPIVWVD